MVAHLKVTKASRGPWFPGQNPKDRAVEYNVQGGYTKVIEVAAMNGYEAVQGYRAEDKGT